MNNKLFWFIAFVLAALFSCWATSTSLLLMMPTLFSPNPIIRTIMVWVLVFLVFVLSSMSIKWIIDALRNDCDNRRTMFWGGLATLIVTWILISLPTNAHTFFYNQQIGAVLSEDLTNTENYSQQLANRSNVDSAFYDLEKKVLQKFSDFTKEVSTGYTSMQNNNGNGGVGPEAIKYFTEVNGLMGYEYQLPTPATTARATSEEKKRIIDNLHAKLISNLKQKKLDQYVASKEIAKDAQDDIKKMHLMQDTVQNLIATNRISEMASEPVIRQTNAVLQDAYTTIKNGSSFVKFNKGDKEIYTADNIETRTSRFFNPYVVMYDFFCGKYTWTFIFWILLSIVIDLMGFFFYYQWKNN